MNKSNDYDENVGGEANDASKGNSLEGGSDYDRALMREVLSFCNLLQLTKRAVDAGHFNAAGKAALLRIVAIVIYVIMSDDSEVASAVAAIALEDAGFSSADVAGAVATVAATVHEN